MILFLLTRCAILAIRLHAPTVIAITGSVGKTTTKDMIVAILREAGMSVRGSRKSYNGEFGVPLSVLNLSAYDGRNVSGWLRNVVLAPWRACVGMPDYVVLEVGLEYPGDISSLTEWLKPDIGVLTHLAAEPVHGAHFPSKDALYREKVSLLEAVRDGGYAVCNGEDTIQKPYIAALPDSIRICEFNGAAVSVTSRNIHYDGGRPVGTDAVLSVDGTDEPFHIPDTLGDGAVQSLVAAVAAVRCVPVGVPVNTIRRAVASRKPTPGRMRILSGINRSVIIDDTYNASPVAVRNSLRTLGVLDGRTKVAVLGGMAQLGADSRDIHRDIGEYAVTVADHVFVIGDAEYGTGETVRRFESHADAAHACRELAASGTVFLCKGSQVARIERVVESLLEPGVDPAAVLIRQEAGWKRG